MREIIYNFFYYLFEGTSIGISVWLFVTRFFGYPVRRPHSVIKVFTGCTIFYIFLGVFLNYSFSREGERKAINGFLILFLLIYMTVLTEEKKFKAFFLALCACNMYTVFVSISYVFENVLAAIMRSPGTMTERFLLFMHPMILLILWGLSVLSGKRRKKPMAFPLVAAAFLLMVLTDNLITALLPEKYIGDQPLFSFRVLYEGERSDAIGSLFLLCVFILLFIVCLIYIIKESESLYFREKNAVSEHYLEIQREHYERLTASNREMKKIRHDMKNHAYCLAELYEKGNYDELGAYIGDMAARVEQADTEVHTGNEIADAIISEKKRRAEESGIAFSVEGGLGSRQLSALDICTILANTLDNAIEASLELPEAQRKISLSFRKNDHFIMITCENKTAERVEIADGNVSTTKSDRDNHGYGIINVRETVEKNGGEYVLSFEGANGEGYAGVFRSEVFLPILEK